VIREVLYQGAALLRPPTDSMIAQAICLTGQVTWCRAVVAAEGEVAAGVGSLTPLSDWLPRLDGYPHQYFDHRSSLIGSHLLPGHRPGLSYLYLTLTLRG
jgi:hypothetical protein